MGIISNKGTRLPDRMANLTPMKRNRTFTKTVSRKTYPQKISTGNENYKGE